MKKQLLNKKILVMKKTTILETITVLYIILFLYTGISKVMDFGVFKEQIATSPLLAPVSRLIAIAVPAVEFLATLMLIVPRWRLKGLYGSLGLMVAFTGYIIAVLLLNKEIPCSCGGVIELMSWSQHIIFNSIFIALAITAIFIEKRVKHNKQVEYSSIINVRPERI